MSVLEAKQPALVRKARPARWWPFGTALLLTLVFFAALAPTLPWIDFSGGMENFNIETALEMARDGHWVVPTLEGRLRTQKPPLAEWITALGILSSDSLAWGARWPSLVCAALTLLAAYELGRLAGGPSLGLLALCICGTNYLFLKFAREASYDIQLALWVTVTNVCLGWALLRREWWLGCAGAGAALGLALMTKGPPAILQTIVPAVFLILYERFVARPSDRDPRAKKEWDEEKRPRVLAPVALGVALALAIALPWTGLMLAKFPGQMSEWWNEVSLGTEWRLDRRIGVYFAYLAFPAWLLPWTIWLLVGFRLAVRRDRSGPRLLPEHRRALRLMVAWVLVPLVVMWFFPERRDRYVIPMIPPAAVIAGWGLIRSLSQISPSGLNARLSSRLPFAAHWCIVMACVIGLPVAGALGIGPFRTIRGEAWFSTGQAIGLLLTGTVILAYSIQLQRPIAALLVGGTFVVILVAQAAAAWGYARSPNGVSPSRAFVAEIRRQYPHAIVYDAVNRAHRRDLPLEMTIYFNRVIPRLDDVRRLKREDDPQLIIFPDGAADPPGKFRLVARQWIKEEWWNAYVLPAVK